MDSLGRLSVCSWRVRHTGIHSSEFSGEAKVCMDALVKELQASLVLPLEGLLHLLHLFGKSLSSIISLNYQPFPG